MRLGDVFPVVIVKSHPNFPIKWEKTQRHLVEECGVPSPTPHHVADTGTYPSGMCRSLSVLDVLTLRSIDSDASDHVGMIRRASTDHPDEPFILFVDDTARFDQRRISPGGLDAIRRCLMKPGVDILFLGHMPYGSMMSFYTSPGIIRCFSMNVLSHAYALTRTGMHKILGMTTDDHPSLSFGQFVRRAHLCAYAVYPVMSFPYREPPLFTRFKDMIPFGSAMSFHCVNDVMVEMSIALPVILLTMTVVLVIHTVRHTVRHIRRRHSMRIKNVV